MTGTILAQYSDDDRSVVLQKPRRGRGYELVFGTDGGLEAAIRFTDVRVTRNLVEFRFQYSNHPAVKTGSIENSLGALGGVGDWIREHAVETAEGVTA